MGEKREGIGILMGEDEGKGKGGELLVVGGRERVRREN